MSLPTKDDVGQFNYSLRGAPWVKGAANSSIDVFSWDYSLTGAPWTGQPVAAAAGSGILAINTTSFSAISDFGVVPVASVKSKNGVLT